MPGGSLELTPATDHRRTQYDATQFGSKINAVQKNIGAKKKAKEDASELLEEKKKLEAEKKEKEAEAAEKLAKLLTKTKTVGNYVYKDVPVSDSEDNNAVQKTWAPADRKAEFKADGIPHHGVLARLNGYDPERGTKIVGHRGYCLTGYGVFLNQALINYGLEFLVSAQSTEFYRTLY